MNPTNFTIKNNMSDETKTEIKITFAMLMRL